MSEHLQHNQTGVKASLVGQVGCVIGLVAIGIIFLALFVGRYLDNYFGTNGVFTIIFMLGSFPITLFVMVRMSLYMVKRSQERMTQYKKDQKQKNSTQEEE